MKTWDQVYKSAQFTSLLEPLAPVETFKLPGTLGTQHIKR